MLFVESNWDMWNTPLRAEGQRDAVHKCWCYCRNSRSFSFWTQLKHPNSESWLWKFGKLNHLISGWGKEGTLWSRTVLGIKSIKEDCGMLYCILIFLNCMGSWGVLPLACKSNLNTFRLFDLYDPICMYMYLYIHPWFPFLNLHPHLHFLQSSSASFSDCEFYMIPPHDNLPLPITKKKKTESDPIPRGRALSMPDAGRKAWRTWGCRVSSPWYQGWPALYWTYPVLVGGWQGKPPSFLKGLPWSDFWDLKSGIYWHCQIPAAILLVSSGSDMECHQVNTLGE